MFKKLLNFILNQITRKRTHTTFLYKKEYPEKNLYINHVCFGMVNVYYQTKKGWTFEIEGLDPVTIEFDKIKYMTNLYNKDEPNGALLITLKNK